MDIDYEIKSFIQSLIPFGSADVAAAVQAAVDAGQDGSWAAEQVEQYMKDTGSSLDDIDPVAIVYESLLQEARNNIDNLTGIDILNDTREQVYVYGNFMYTYYDYSQEAIQEIIDIFREHKNVTKADLDIATKWFLDQLDIDIDLIEAED